MSTYGRLLLAGAAAFGLSGCGAVADATGAITGIATGAASANPVVGYGVGLAVRAGADAGLRHVARRWHRTEQEAIAEAIGATGPGQNGHWQVRHTLPIGNRQGEIHALRDIPSALALCREALFSVAGRGGAQWFATTACRGEARWSWAVAEPAVPRWGNLQ